MSYYDPYAVDPGAVAPEDAAALAYMLGGQSDIYGGAAPYMYPGQYMSLAGTVPGSPDDDAMLDFLKSGTNYFQDFMQMTADPMIAALAGSSAFAPGAFEPVVTTNVVDRPNYRRLSALAQSDPTSYEGMIARALLVGLDQGGATSASAALRQIYAELDQHQPGDDDYLAVLQNMGLPRTQNNEGLTVLDDIALRDVAHSMEMALYDDPQPGSFDAGEGKIGERIIDPETGELVEQVSEESPLAEHFRELGLPDPTQEFTPEYILGPEWASQAADWGASRTTMDEAMANYLDAVQAERDYRAPSYADAAAPATAVRDEETTPLNADEQAMLEDVRSRIGQPPDISQLGAGMATLDPEVIGPLAEQLAAEGHELPPHWTYVINPDGSTGPPIIAGGGAGGAYLQGKMLPRAGLKTPEAARALYGNEEPSPVDPDFLAALGLTPPPPPLDPNAPLLSAAPQGPVAPPQPPRPPLIPPNQGGFAPDINLTPAGGLPGPPGRDQMQDAMLAALLGGGPLTGQLPWRGVPDRGVDLGGLSAVDRQMRDAALGNQVWQAVPGRQLPPAGETLNYTPDWQAAAQSGRDLGEISATDSQMYQAMLDDMVWQAAPQTGTAAVAASAAADPFFANLASGNIQMRPPSQISQYLSNATVRPRTSGATGQRRTPAGGTQISQYLANAAARGTGGMGAVRTGEEGETRRQRTEEERRALARRNAPRDLQGEEYDVLSSGYGGSGRRRRTSQARRAWHDAWLGYQTQNRAASVPYAQAKAIARNMSDQGITPYMLNVAARQQVPMAAGIRSPGRVY